jgi:exopolysaccharide production protein ExoQ
MPPAVASLIFIPGIAFLFYLDRDRESRTSPALWFPIVWLGILLSRSVSRWFSPAAALDTMSAESYLDGSPVDRAVAFGFIIVGLVILSMRRERAVDIIKKNWPVMLFLLFSLVSASWADLPFVAFKRWTKALGALGMVLVVLTDPDPVAAMKKLFTRTAFILIPTSVLLIKYYPQLSRYYDRWEGTAYYSGVATDKNMLGCICLCLGLGLVWQFVQSFGKGPEGNKRLLAYGTVIAMNLWLFHHASSSTSLSCFVLGTALIVILFSKSRPMMMHAGVLAAATFIVVGVLSPAFVAFVVGSLGRNMTLTGRTDLWADLLKMDTNPWFGVGFESFFVGDRVERLWKLYWWHPNEAHNGYLEIYLTLGRVGILLLLLLVVTGYRNAISTYRRDPRAGSVKLAFLVVILLYNITEAAFKVIHPVWAVFLLAVMAVPEVAAASEAATAPEKARASLEVVKPAPRLEAPAWIPPSRRYEDRATSNSWPGPRTAAGFAAKRPKSASGRD